MKTRYISSVLVVLTFLLVLPQPGQALVAAAAPAQISEARGLSPLPDLSWQGPTLRQDQALGQVIVADIPPTMTRRAYLPMLSRMLTCETGESYGGFNPNGMADPPAALSADMNLSLRGYDNVDSRGYTNGLVFNLASNPDGRAPKLDTMLNWGSRAQYAFTHNYQAYNWNWPPVGPLPYGAKGARLDPNSCPISQCWQVSVLGFHTNVGQTVYLPTSGYGDIAGGQYYALVLYATDTSITLKYTSEDSVVSGYTIHVDNVCVDPNLVAAYNNDNNNHGRKPLPALRAHQAFGIATSSEIRVAIRDNGNFMDPRSQQDWWH